MYKTIVTTQKIGDLEPLYPLFIWFILMIVSIILLAFTDFAVILLLFGFLDLIPIFYFIIKYKKSFKQRKKGYEKKEVVFSVINGELYVDNKKMKVSQNKFKREIYVNDIVIKVIKSKFTITRAPIATFNGIIEEPYVNDFEKFLKEQGIKIIQE